jgi:hypothetical protein
MSCGLSAQRNGLGERLRWGQQTERLSNPRVEQSGDVTNRRSDPPGSVQARPSLRFSGGAHVLEGVSQLAAA